MCHVYISGILAWHTLIMNYRVSSRVVDSCPSQLSLPRGIGIFKQQNFKILK